jgi:hypothetical protein
MLCQFVAIRQMTRTAHELSVAEVHLSKLLYFSDMIMKVTLHLLHIPTDMRQYPIDRRINVLHIDYHNR